MNRKIQIVSTSPAAKKQTTTINYVNPSASNMRLLTMASMLNALTNNTFVSATKIDTTTLTAKIVPAITLSPTTISFSDLVSATTSSSHSLNITISGNLGEVSPTFKIQSNSVDALNGIIVGGSDTNIYMAYVLNNVPSTNATIIITFPETDTFAAVEKEFVITS